MARKRATDLSKTRYDDAGTDSTACDFWSWQYYSVPVNIMAEYVSATLPVILSKQLFVHSIGYGSDVYGFFH